MIMQFLYQLINFLRLLVFGLIQSKKSSFLAGFYSFLILLFLQLYSFIFPHTIKPLIDNMSEPPFGKSISEFVAILNLIPKTVNLIAFSILIIGLYKRFKK
ncbi:hypothetical protein H1D32_22670 [Anaerobacillus sp. CMMVII]|uniref:hypothetical protein n=1 Tax=Anaerobacillus sp. CMMVII TaxID=2755588 RepID=UPI0021B7D79C|nr:hypothetical protein [Anaerobacillus sp. CMMVII]MCT8140255.1 hypothetical protein [Anaerobacillus sp. CMMVII]